MGGQDEVSTRPTARVGSLAAMAQAKLVPGAGPEVPFVDLLLGVCAFNWRGAVRVVTGRFEPLSKRATL